MEEVKYSFISEMELMKSDMVFEIVSSLGDVTGHVGTKDCYEEVAKEFEIVRWSGKDINDHVGIPIGNRFVQFARHGSQLRLKYKMGVSNFSSTLTLEELID